MRVKTPWILAHATIDVRVDVPASSLDLPGWLFALSDAEYQRCSRCHIAAGASLSADGRRTSVNVESVGGHLAVQHYVAEISRTDHLRLVSARTDAWLFHLLHVHPKVTWEMRLLPTSPQSCIFRCAVSVEHPSVLLKAASLLTLFPFFVRRHDHDEARRFAESLAERRAPPTSRTLLAGLDDTGA